MKKITQKATIKAAMIAGIMTLMFQPFVGLGQYYQLDGNNCNATNGVEWSDADAVLDTDPTAVTASSNLLKFWGGISGKDFVIATEREASGSAFFAFYLNVDCDATNNDTSKSGADVALFYNILNGVIQDFTIYEYNAATSAYVATLNTFTGAVGNSICEDNLTDKQFIEMSMSLADIFDLCSDDLCGNITVTAAATHAGTSASSTVKDFFVVKTAVPANTPPTANFSSTDSVACIGETITLDGLASIDGDEGNGNGDFITSYQWDLDYNGTFSEDFTGSSPSATLITSGLHSIALIVTDNFDCKDTVISNINVYARPEAIATLLYSAGVAPVCAYGNYDGSASVDNTGANNLTYSWGFGDGNSSSSDIGTHPYLNCDNLNGTFTVIDPDNHNKCAADTLFFIGILPVELIHFDAKVNAAGNNTLNWSTASEQNNNGFYILRSSDGANWDEVNFVKGSGNSTQIVSYQWTDMDATNNNGAVYYKLKQVDFNGTATLSESRSVVGEKAFNPIVYPNPADAKLNINLGTIDESQKITIDIVNQFGQIVISQTQVGINVYSLSVDNLSSGIYYAKVGMNGSYFTHKFLKK